MILTETDIQTRLAADFGGRLLFQPISTTGDNIRPVAQLAGVAQLLPRATDLGALQAGDSLRHTLQDLLHHHPQPRHGRT